MKSIFLRRLLLALIITLLIASATMVGGYAFISRDTYTEIKLKEMAPKADAAEQLIIEFLDGQITEEAFIRLSKTQMLAVNGATLFVDQENRCMQYQDSIFGMSPEDMQQALSEEITTVLSGEKVSTDSVRLPGKRPDALVVGTPIFMPDGSLAGGIFVIKSAQEIIGATAKLSTSLFWIAAIVLPVTLLITSWRIRRITEPLHTMSEAAIAMSKGNFDIRVNEDEIGEVGVLARALNGLCAGLSQTIYQLKTEKSQLDQILQSLTDGVAATDEVGMLTHYNAALMRMFGAVNVEKREELVPDPKIWKAFDEVFETGEPQSITYPMAGDKTLWITIAPVVTDGGQRVGVAGLFKDMTEMERLEAMRREYVANVSHELRTPLTAVRGLLEPLADGMVKDEEDRQRYYRIMLHEVLRLSRLITDMMTLSRLQSGTEYMEVVRVDMNTLIRDIASGYSGPARQKGIELVVDSPKPVPDAMTDPDRIEQVLIILIDNAMRYTPEGGTITIGMCNAKDSIILTVTDTGCGISKDDLPHIFERFYKVDKSRGEGGTGLGLSIAQFIMEKLGESITVESEPGKGTRFILTVKRYVRNAIALGPAGEGRGRYGYEQAEEPNERKDDKENGTDTIVDAPYEVIESPEKETVEKAGTKKETSSKREGQGKRE
ncbi:MAG: ATP-binding protein [bacterium]|nr:ATP-binding protein [bacterium]